MRILLPVVGLLSVLLSTISSGGRSGTSRDAQVGCASWYGKDHHGRKTASGDRFSKWQLTAAHRSLPLGTKVKVTHLQTSRQVMVTINDRGPYGKSKRCLIDLSEAAARRIGLAEEGVARVQVVVVESASGGPAPKRRS